ncbi:MAG: hypothetical protein QXV17_14760, partial [Candidatus Micrarchaeaceae archaeon]
RHGDIVPIDMFKLANDEELQDQFTNFIEFLISKIIQKNRLKIALWDKHEEILELDIHPDFSIGFDDEERKIRGISLVGRYSFNIPYRVIDSLYVSIIGDFKGD